MDSLTISIAALVVSVVVALWNAYRYVRWERPVIRVKGSQWTDLRDPRGPRAGFETEIVNTGDHSTQIVRVYWEVDHEALGLRPHEARHGGGVYESLFENEEDSRIPAVPFALARHDRRGWTFTMPMHIGDGAYVRARPVVEYGSRRGISRAKGRWAQWTG